MRFVPALAPIVLLVCLASPLMAQFGQPGRRPDGGQSRVGRNQIPKFATTNELQAFNAADALLKDAGKLKLTEDQVTQLTALRGTLYERNADLIVRYEAIAPPGSVISRL